jgi:hypothetical protein
MSRATSSRKIAVAVAALFLGGVAGAAAQSIPDGEHGRYTMSPVTDGVIRLDTRTGAISVCNNANAGWACYEKVKAELEKLKAESAAREPTVSGKIEDVMPKSDSLKKAEPKVAEGERKFEIPLPSDRDMDRVMSFLEQAWRRLIEMANRMQKDVGGKI